MTQIKILFYPTFWKMTKNLQINDMPTNPNCVHLYLAFLKTLMMFQLYRNNNPFQEEEVGPPLISGLAVQPLALAMSVDVTG